MPAPTGNEVMITIVSPWYGPDTTGGAETQARSLARALHGIGVPVQVWSSTARDSFHPDDNHYYLAGRSVLDGVPLWRFPPAAPTDAGVPAFFRQHPHLLPPMDQFLPHERALLGSLLSSDELYAAIVAAPSDMRFIFLPYPFPTTFYGALLAPQQSFVLPCLHDEPYAYYSTYRYLFQQVAGLLANSHPEAALARRLSHLPAGRVYVPGEGIDLASRGDGAAFRQRYDLPADLPLLLYVGRRDASKNVPLLLAYVREYWARRGGPLRLLLAGRGAVPLPARLDARRYADAPLLDLGFVDEQTKHDAHAAADVFVLPSQYESFSIVLMEAWLQQTPALVYNRSDVTTDHCRRSGGGIAFGDFATFAMALDLLLMRPDLRAILGQRGHAYVRDTCDWSRVARRTAAAVLEQRHIPMM